MRSLSALLITAVVAACQAKAPAPAVLGPVAARMPIAREGDPRELHLSRLRQLTDGGENVEAYFSFDGRRRARCAGAGKG